MKKNNKRTTQNTPINNPRSKLVSESIFILLMMVGAIFFISLITSSISEDPWTGGSVLNEPVVNKAGVFGAYLSDISFAIFGYVSYLIPIAIVWLGYNFHRDANKERQSQLTFLLRLISFFVMLFFIAALAHQYAPNIELMDNIKVAFLLGGWVGESMHEHLFYGVFGDSSTLIYVGIILVSFSVATSASWKNITTSLFKNRLNKREKTQDKPKKEKIKPEIISSKPASAESVKIDNPNKAEKAEKPKKAEKAEKPKKAEKPQKEQGSNLFKSGDIGRPTRLITT